MVQTQLADHPVSQIEHLPFIENALDSAVKIDSWQTSICLSTTCSLTSNPSCNRSLFQWPRLFDRLPGVSRIIPFISRNFESELFYSPKKTLAK
jgi:hypothetical protein